MRKTTFGRKSRLAAILCAAMACLNMTAYALPTTATLTSSQAPVITIEDTEVPLAGGTKVLKPESSGKVTYQGGGVTIDASNTSQGYVMIKYGGANKKIKVQITRQGKSTYTYNLNARGSYEVFPLTGGDGKYKIGIYTNISGTQYAEALSKSIDVKLKDAKLPYLYPSQYVNFNENSKTVKKGEELAKTASGDLGIVENVYNYVIKNISYDTRKAETVQSGYLPVVDTILESGKGICFDYAAVMASMLRSQQIPTRLEVGYVSNGAYHAWISTYITDVGWVNGVIQFDGKNWKLMDPTFASSGNSSSGIMKYIGNGSNYKTQYLY